MLSQAINTVSTTCCLLPVTINISCIKIRETWQNTVCKITKAIYFLMHQIEHTEKLNKNKIDIHKIACDCKEGDC